MDNREPRSISGTFAFQPHIGRAMLFIAGGVIVLIAVAFIPLLMREPDGVNSANLGSMSERWLAEHRASRSR